MGGKESTIFILFFLDENKKVTIFLIKYYKVGFNELSIDLEAKILSKMSDYDTNTNISWKCPKQFEVVLLFLLAFSILYIIESGFSHVNSILTKQK